MIIERYFNYLMTEKQAKFQLLNCKTKWIVIIYEKREKIVVTYTMQILLFTNLLTRQKVILIMKIDLTIFNRLSTIQNLSKNQETICEKNIIQYARCAFVNGRWFWFSLEIKRFIILFQFSENIVASKRRLKSQSDYKQLSRSRFWYL